MDGEIAQDMYKLTEADGFLGLTWLDSGSRSFYTANTPIRTPADLNGLMIRTMDSQMAIDMMTALGGASKVMGYGDIFTAMQNHNVDGRAHPHPRHHRYLLQGLERDERCPAPGHDRHRS